MEMVGRKASEMLEGAEFIATRCEEEEGEEEEEEEEEEGKGHMQGITFPLHLLSTTDALCSSQPKLSSRTEFCFF